MINVVPITVVVVGGGGGGVLVVVTSTEIAADSQCGACSS
jgi:hypothetical protein